jgi:hypothetical protein
MLTDHNVWCSQRLVKVLKAPQSGSQAGTTASHNRFGQYERNRRAPVQPIGNGRRAFIRAAFGASSNAWSSLTGAQQAAWTAYADSHPITDSLGQSVKLTGHMMFVAISTQLQNLVLPISNDPPASATVAPLTGVSLYVDSTPTVIVTALSSDGASWILNALSKQVSAGVTFMKTFCQLNFGNGTSFATDLSEQYETQFGNPSVGNKVFARITPVNAFGVGGTPTIVSAIAPSAPTIPTAVATSPSAGTVTATWTGGGSYNAYSFVKVTGIPGGFATDESGPAVSPIAGLAVTTGLTAYVRLTDGVKWGGPSNTVVVT